MTLRHKRYKGERVGNVVLEADQAEQAESRHPAAAQPGVTLRGIATKIEPVRATYSPWHAVASGVGGARPRVSHT